MNNEILILDPVQAEKDRQIKSEGFQYHRNCILRALFYLTFSEKFKIVKKVDREILARFNTYQGTKTVHTLNYMHKMPSRKKELSKIDDVVLLLRTIGMACEVREYQKEKRKKLIRLVK